MRSVVALLLVLSACRSAPEEVPLPPTEPMKPAPPTFDSSRSRLTASDVDELQIWSKTVLEVADTVTLLRLLKDTRDVLSLLGARWREAGSHYPYMMTDYRHALQERIEYESARLRLIEAKIGSKH